MMTLHEKAVHLMNCRASELTFAEIAKQIDASPAWVSAFSRGLIPNPGVHTIQKLVEFLEGWQA